MPPTIRCSLPLWRKRYMTNRGLRGCRRFICSGGLRPPKNIPTELDVGRLLANAFEVGVCLQNSTCNPCSILSIVILPMRTGGGDDLFMKFWTWKQENLPSITHAIRTAVAATVSVVIAQLLQMPAAYWAAISTLVVMQSPPGAT